MSARTTTAGPAGSPAAPTALNWQIERVDGRTFSEMGQRSLALDASGHPHIAYGEDHLYYARYDGTSWHLETVDPSWWVGLYTSLALDGMGRPHISYFDWGNGDLKYAYSVCVPVEGVSVAGPVELAAGQTGLYTATAAPPTATLPITFTWDNGTVGATAAYSWTARGTYTITVTGTNVCGGEPRVGRLAVRILAEWPHAVYLPLVFREYGP